MSKLEYRDIKQPNYRHVGKYTPRKDAKDIVTGKAIFLDDFSVPHMLYGKTKRSPYPHARILSIDTSRGSGGSDCSRYSGDCRGGHRPD